MKLKGVTLNAKLKRMASNAYTGKDDFECQIGKDGPKRLNCGFKRLNMEMMAMST